MPGELDDKIDQLLFGSWNAASRASARYKAVSEELLEAIRLACTQVLPTATEALRDRFSKMVADSDPPQSAQAPLEYTFNYAGSAKAAVPFLYVTVGLVHTGVRPVVRVVSCLANPVAKYISDGTRVAVKEKLGDVSPMDPVRGNANDFAASTVPVADDDLDWSPGATARYDAAAQKVASEFDAHVRKFGPLLLEMIKATCADSNAGSAKGESSA